MYFSCKSSWGAWQISEDKTKVLIYEDNMHEIYLLDGNDGAISYKGKIKHTAFPNSTFNYLITTKLVPEEEMINFEVFDLNTMKEIYSFSWMSQKENFLKRIWNEIFHKQLMLEAPVEYTQKETRKKLKLIT